MTSTFFYIKFFILYYFVLQSSILPGSFPLFTSIIYIYIIVNTVRAGGCSRGVMVIALDCRIIVNEYGLQ